MKVVECTNTDLLTREVSASEANPAMVGDLLVASWGWGQSNVNFYRVVRVTAKSVEVEPVSSVVASDGGTYQMVVADETWPRARDVLTGIGVNGNTKSTKTCRVTPDERAGYVVTLSGRYTAVPWNGVPVYRTAPGYGH